MNRSVLRSQRHWQPFAECTSASQRTAMTFSPASAASAGTSDDDDAETLLPTDSAPFDAGLRFAHLRSREDVRMTDMVVASSFGESRPSDDSAGSPDVAGAVGLPPLSPVTTQPQPGRLARRPACVQEPSSKRAHHTHADAPTRTCTGCLGGRLRNRRHLATGGVEERLR